MVPMTLIDHIHRVKESDGSRVAMIAGDRRWTYEEFHWTVQHLAVALSSLGIQYGDRVALQLGNRPELVFAYYACFQLGAISVPVNNRFASPEIEYTINHSGCRVCICQSDLYANVVPIRSALTTLEQVFLVDGDASMFPNVRSFNQLLDMPAHESSFPKVPDAAVAAILYTSGTTSRPKGVTHTHRSLDATARLHGKHIGLGADDVVCVVPPMCHILGFATQMITSLWAGATIVIIPRSDPETVLRAIESCKATRIAALPTLYQALINHPGAEQFCLKSLRTGIGGGDAVPLALQEKFLATFRVQILEGCGMTEIVPFTLNLPNEFRKGSIGRKCPGATIRLTDENGIDVPTGFPGEILVRSDAQFVGYWKEPEITAYALAGGFVHTGDLGRIDEDGFYWFAGRKKEIIIRGGSNISPLEVEEVLYQHPAIRECGVVGVPDDDLGEVVWAYVAARTPVTPEELQQFVRQKIAPYRVPEVISFLEELPKGATGKVHRRSLRERAKMERWA